MRKKRTLTQVDPEQCRAYLLAREQRDKAMAAMTVHRAATRAAMGELASGVRPSLTEFQTGPFKIRSTSHTRDHLDQASLKQENPGIAAQYTTTREVKTFTITLDHATVLQS